MIGTKQKGLRVSAACAVVLMLLLSMLPGNPLVTSQKVEAYGEDTDGYFYAETYLYDYDYDPTDFGYDHDTQTYYGTPLNYSETQCRDTRQGDRWMTGLQVPYEMLNRDLSDYYASAPSNVPALYFGNFFGTTADDDINNPYGRGTGDGQDPYQYTYIIGQDGNKWYSDAYRNYWQSANNAPKNGGHSAVQGLVDKTLTDGTLTQGSGAIKLPQFNDAYVSTNSRMHRYETGKGFPFNIETDSHGIKTYSFDSANDGKRYYEGGQIKVGTNGTVNWRSDGQTMTSGQYGFFPFNTTDITDTIRNRQSVDYGFGMKVIIPFTLNSTGTLIGDDGYEVDAKFDFSGDDDVWVFIDDVLVLDIGGDHAVVSGSINFNREKQSQNNTVYVSEAAQFSSSQDRRWRIQSYAPQYTSLTAAFQSAGRTFDPDTFYSTETEHTMTVFYMERGMFESNLSMGFNFAPSNPHKLTVEEQTKFDHVNEALLSQTKTVADRDVFNYTIQNQGTKANQVVNSGIDFPNYENINRVNSEANGAPTTILASEENIQTHTVDTYTTETKEYVYFDVSQQTWWKDANADTWAYFFGNGEKWVKMSFTTNIYSCEKPSGYTGVIFVRKPSGSSSGFSGKWNQTEDLSIHANSYYYKLNSTGDTTSCISTASATYPYSETTRTLSGTTEVPYTFGDKFTGGTGMTPLANVPYTLSDPFAAAALTGITGTGNATGQFNLFYGEAATFKYQFAKDSTMSVVQAEYLNGSDAALGTTMTSETVPGAYHNHTFTQSTRSVADYYDTTVTAIDENYEGNDQRIAEYASLQTEGINYTFKNKAADAHHAIYLHQTFINTVKVGDLVIGKEVQGEDNSTKTFTFDVTLTNLFGDDTNTAVDISTLQYEIFPKDTTDFYGNRSSGFGYVVNGVSITEDQIAVIKGIPVQTGYQVSERADYNYEQKSLTNATGIITEGSYTYNPDGDVTGTIVSNNGASSIKASAVNERKVGDLVITKTVTGDGANINDSFPVTVTFTAPTDATIDLSRFITENSVIVSGNISNLSMNLPTVTFNIKHNGSVTIKNIPYGTTYTVDEDAGDYVKTIDYNDPGKIIDDVPVTATGDRPDQVTITNRKDAARIVLTKKNNLGTSISGAEFAIYLNEADAIAKNNNTVTYAEYTKSNDGKVFTFSKLKPKTTYYIAETTVPKGHTGLSRPLTITTGDPNSEVKKDVFNPVIEIVMPETGVLPSPLNMTVVGLSVIGIAAVALIIYRRRLQAEAAYTDKKEV